ncbi:MAG: hypothetical protein JWL81_3305, partial [Verrucomicrobiales bacterium]|nr:hypothetical protein [Verrucomicrobiales bacterium]
MIIDSKENPQHLASAWTAGIVMLFLAIGLSGAGTPLAPALPPLAAAKPAGPAEEPMIEVFSEEGGSAPPPASGPETEAAEPDPHPVPEVAELPPLPDLPPPLTPPEMPEIV